MKLEQSSTPQRQHHTHAGWLLALSAAIAGLGCFVTPDNAPPPLEDSTASDSADIGVTIDAHDMNASIRDSAVDVDMLATQGPPNIILIIADDFGVEAAALDPASPCYTVGAPEDAAKMPHIASLCDRGVRFDEAWAYPTCSPTRATMLTGEYPLRHGVGTAIKARNSLPIDAETLPERLSAAPIPYVSANIGKWHVSQGADDPRAQGYDTARGTIAGTLPDFREWKRVVDGQENDETRYATSVAVDDSIDWLEEIRLASSPHRDKPFFLWLAFHAPHTPLHVPPAHLHSRSIDDSADDAEKFAAMCEALDAEVGRLFEHLESTDEFDNTIVIFMGDNGTAKSTTRSPYNRNRAKASLYEGGIRVPLIIAGPGVRDGSERSLVSIVDLHATILELAGALPAGEDSVSLAGRLSDPSAPSARRYSFSEHLAAGQGAGGAQYGRTIRDETHKYICVINDDGSTHEELYDLRDGLGERTDLLGAPLDDTGQAAIGQLKAQMSELLSTEGVELECE